MEHISRFINNHNLLSNVCRPVRNNKKQNPLLLAIQLVLTHFSLTAEPDTARARAWSFSSSQQMAYLPSMERPILKGPSGLEVDVEWCLHIANFFKSHFLGKQEALYSAYNDLMDTERPQCWLKPLNKGSQKLGTHWKGAFGECQPCRWPNQNADSVQPTLGMMSSTTFAQALMKKNSCLCKINSMDRTESTVFRYGQRCTHPRIIVTKTLARLSTSHPKIKTCLGPRSLRAFFIP